MEPILVKSLKLLRDNSKSLTVKEIAEKIQEDQISVEKVLEKLIERKIVAKTGEYYRYQKTSTNEEFSEKMLAVYTKVSRKSEMELTIIGLLSTATQYNYFLRQKALSKVIEEEGFNPNQINDFLEEELNSGRIRKLRIAIINKEEKLIPCPPAIHPSYVYHYFSHWMELDEYERIKKKYIQEGFYIQEEDYLIANFPSEMADPAREYLEKEMTRVRQKIRDESFQWWYGLKTWRQLR